MPGSDLFLKAFHSQHLAPFHEELRKIQADVKREDSDVLFEFLGPDYFKLTPSQKYKALQFAGNCFREDFRKCFYLYGGYPIQAKKFFKESLAGSYPLLHGLGKLNWTIFLEIYDEKSKVHYRLNNLIGFIVPNAFSNALSPVLDQEFYAQIRLGSQAASKHIMNGGLTETQHKRLTSTLKLLQDQGFRKLVTCFMEQIVRSDAQCIENLKKNSYFKDFMNDKIPVDLLQFNKKITELLNIEMPFDLVEGLAQFLDTNFFRKPPSERCSEFCTNSALKQWIIEKSSNDPHEDNHRVILDFFLREAVENRPELIKKLIEDPIGQIVLIYTEKEKDALGIKHFVQKDAEFEYKKEKAANSKVSSITMQSGLEKCIPQITDRLFDKGIPGTCDTENAQYIVIWNKTGQSSADFLPIGAFNKMECKDVRKIAEHEAGLRDFPVNANSLIFSLNCIRGIWFSEACSQVEGKDKEIMRIVAQAFTDSSQRTKDLKPVAFSHSQAKQILFPVQGQASEAGPPPLLPPPPYEESERSSANKNGLSALECMSQFIQKYREEIAAGSFEDKFIAPEEIEEEWTLKNIMKNAETMPEIKHVCVCLRWLSIQGNLMQGPVPLPAAIKKAYDSVQNAGEHKNKNEVVIKM